MSDLKKYDGASDGIPYSKFRGNVPFLHSLPGYVYQNPNADSPTVQQIANIQDVPKLDKLLSYQVLSKKMTGAKGNYPDGVHKLYTATALHTYNPDRFKSAQDAQSYIDYINRKRQTSSPPYNLKPIPKNIYYVNYGNQPIKNQSALPSKEGMENVGVILGGQNYKASRHSYGNAANYHEFTHILNNIDNETAGDLKSPILRHTYTYKPAEYLRTLSSIKEEAPYLGFKYPETLDDYAKVLTTMAEMRADGQADGLNQDIPRTLEYIDEIHNQRDDWHKILTRAESWENPLEVNRNYYQTKIPNKYLFNNGAYKIFKGYSPYDRFGIESLKKGFKQYPTPLKEDAKRDFDLEAKRYLYPGEDVLPYIY